LFISPNSIILMITMSQKCSIYREATSEYEIFVRTVFMKRLFRWSSVNCRIIKILMLGNVQV
jgi:hypothetical protein